MNADDRMIIERYVHHALQYMENGLAALQKGEAGKAGELLWDSVAESAHALATAKDVRLQSHRQLHNFMIQLAGELNDRSIAENFLSAESLHHNYYEVQLEPADIEIAVPQIRDLVRKLIDLVQPIVPGESTARVGSSPN